MRNTLYQTITDQIVAALEKGVKPWHKPWKVDDKKIPMIRPLRANGMAYQGINVLLLWSAAVDKGYSSPFWLTFKQALALKAHVRKGETSSIIIYANKIVKPIEEINNTENDQHKEIVIPFLKAYSVFNADQIEGLPDYFYAKPETMPLNNHRINDIDVFFKNTEAKIIHGGNHAMYDPRADIIHMPHLEVFDDSGNYYATLSHEAVHWTKRQDRLNRDFGRKRFGDEGYAMEELVAELGAAFLSADLGLNPDAPRSDHADYIGHWLKVLKNDNRAIFNAASHAQQAVNLLHELQPQEQTETPELCESE